MGKSACQEYALMVATILGNLLYAVWRRGQFELPLTTNQYLALHVIAQGDNYRQYLGIYYVELHPDVMNEYTINQAWFCSFLRSLGFYSNAETMEVRRLETRKRVLGEEHPDTLTSMANLALTYWTKDDGRRQKSYLYK